MMPVRVVKGQLELKSLVLDLTWVFANVCSGFHGYEDLENLEQRVVRIKYLNTGG